MPRACPLVAVVGAGFCGTMIAVQLARVGGVAVVLIDRSGRFGPGLAYGAARPFHLLNTPAGRMSAFPDEPEHFTRWAHGHDASVHGGSFLPRPRYAAYLEELLAQATGVAGQVPGGTATCPAGQVPVGATTCPPGQVSTGGTTCPAGQVPVGATICPAGQVSPGHARQVMGGPGVTCLTGQVVDVDGDVLRLADGSTLRADAIVLCPGNLPPAAIPALPAALRSHVAHVADAWAFDPARLDADAPALLLGSGLTALDVVLTLVDAGHRGPIHLLSRRGLLPQAHRSQARPRHLAAPDIGDWPATTRGLLAAVRRAVREAEAQGVDWREVITSLRPVTATLWRRLPLAEQARFVRHVRPYWDSHRHRAAPQTHAAIAALREQERLHVHVGRLTHVAADGAKLRVTWRRGASDEVLRVGALINCTGPASDLRETTDPLLRALLARGLARADALGLGLVTDDEGRLPGSSLLLAGALRRPALWESTAVLELATQVTELTATLRAHLGLRAHQPSAGT